MGLLVPIGSALLYLAIAADHIGIIPPPRFGITQMIAAAAFDAVVI